jgi:hypothetical protein
MPCERRNDIRRCHGLRDLVAQALGNGRRGAGGRQHAKPPGHLVAGHARLEDRRHVGQYRRTGGAGDRERCDLALLGLRDHHRHCIEHAVDMATEEIVERRSCSAVVDDGDLDSGLCLQQLGREIKRAPGPATGTEAELAGICLGVVDQLAQRLDAQAVLHDQDQRPGGDLRDRRQLRQIERVVRMQRLGDQRAGRNEEEGMTIGRRARELAQRRNEIAPDLVLDEDRGAEVFTHLLGDQARHDIGGAAGRQPDQEADRLAGEVLRMGRSRRRGEHDRARDES